MTTFEWATLLVGFLSGGALIGIVNWISKKGEVKLDKYYVQLNYRRSDLDNFITNVVLELQFINSSGHQIILKDFSAKFNHAGKTQELIFKGYNVAPADILEAKKVKDIQFILLPLSENISLPLFDIAEDNFNLEINYLLNNKKKNIIIKGGEIKVADQTVNYIIV